ncbi:class I SAM-dependent methyltransferase [Micromonospora sp. DT229]|uniref:class I SAM-dependent methyltransferase n=1 Tax=Micromonospora sp. DT229 TaxID=3393430 RepID=UPI003CEF58CE
MDLSELRKITDLEDRHFWYRERRAILARELKRIGPPRPGARALDIGAAGGGNTRVISEHGWRALATDYSEDVVATARQRGVDAIFADARDLPVESDAYGFVSAMDVLEHIEEDHLVTQEIARVLEPNGTAFITVPCSMSLWSAHDTAVGHVRRYDRRQLTRVIEGAGLVIDRMWSWNVLLRPVVALRRRQSAGSDMEELPALVNGALTAVLVAERYLPVKSLPGVSLMVRAHKGVSG